MKKLHLYILLVLAGGFSGSLAGQTLKGRLADAATHAPLAGAAVWIEGTESGAVADKDGAFVLQLPQPGAVRLAASFLGYEKLILALTVPAEGLDIGIAGMEWREHFLNSGVVVTAQRTRQRTFAAPEAISMLSRSDLISSGARTAPEALMGLTGVWVQKTNHGGGSPFIRGLTGNQTLLLLDGIRLNNSTYRYGPNQYFNTIDALNIERVEVVRGAGSVLYGSDAIGGTIQVFTPESEFTDKGWRWGLSAFGRVISDGMERSGRGALEVASKNFALNGGFSLRDFGDLVAGGKLGREAPSAYSEWAGDLKGRFRLGEHIQLTLAYNGVFQSDVGRYDQVAQRGFALWQFDPQDRQLAYGRLHWSGKGGLFDGLTITAARQESTEGRRSQRRNSPVLTQESDKVRTGALIAELSSRPAAHWRFSTGAEYYHDRVSSSAFSVNQETNVVRTLRGLYADGSEAGNFAVFHSHILDLANWSFQAGLRYNIVDLTIPDTIFGAVRLRPAATVANLSARYALGRGHALSVSFNTGFRAPNINDLSTFGPFDFGIETPAPDLSPERSLTAELGYKLGGPRLAANVAVFYTRLHDLISRVRGSYLGQPTYEGEDVYQKANTGRAFIRGIEADMQYRLSASLSASGSLAYAYGQNVTDDEPLRRIPPLNGRLALTYRSDSGLFGELEYWYASAQERLASGDKSDHRINPEGTPGWQVVNLKAGFLRWRLLQLNAGVNNLFNEAYRIHGSGVDGLGRSLWVSLKAEW